MATPARRHPFLDHPGPIPFAHRGGAAGGLENTLAAFQDAVDLGYRYLETDLRTTADGVLIAFHDEYLDRLTDLRGPVDGLPWSRISRTRIDGREAIPTFDELVSSFPEVRWNLDIKSDAALVPTLDRLRQDPKLLERTCVGSFSDARLVAVREALGDRVCTSAGPGEVRLLRAASLMGRLSRRLWFAADCLQVPPRHGRVPIVDRVLLAAAHGLGLPVHVWTIDQEPVMHRLLDAGVDGIFTDATRTLRSVLRERGQWVGWAGIG